MISSVAGTGATGSATSTAATGGNQKAQLDKDAFLQLLVTQLKNQDPLNPMQPYEFAAQLAQFSSVEQLTQVNDGLAAQSGQLQLSTLLQQTSLSASLMGKNVVCEGNQVSVTAGAQSSVTVEVGGSGGHGVLTVTNNAGQVVATQDLGQVAPGRDQFRLPSNLAPGDYTYNLAVTGSDNTAVPATTYTSGTVGGVYFKDGSIFLRIGGADVPLDSLVEITPAGTPATGA